MVRGGADLCCVKLFGSSISWTPPHHHPHQPSLYRTQETGRPDTLLATTSCRRTYLLNNFSSFFHLHHEYRNFPSRGQHSCVKLGSRGLKFRPENRIFWVKFCFRLFKSNSLYHSVYHNNCYDVCVSTHMLASSTVWSWLTRLFTLIRCLTLLRNWICRG